MHALLLKLRFFKPVLALHQQTEVTIDRNTHIIACHYKTLKKLQILQKGHT